MERGECTTPIARTGGALHYFKVLPVEQLAVDCGVPRVRATVERAMLESLAIDPALNRHVRESVGPDLVEYIENARGAAWLDYDRTTAFRRAQVDYYGWEQTREHYTSFMLKFTEGPLMRALAHALIRIFGIHAEKVHRVYPRIWSVFTRDAGRVEGELLGDGSSRIYFVGPPVEADEYEFVLVMHEAALHAMFRFAELPVAIRREGAGRDAQFMLTW